MMILNVFAANNQRDIAMECTQQDARSTIQEITKNTSDPVLFIVVEDLDTIDLPIWNNRAENS
jgi:hypothetical protein